MQNNTFSGLFVGQNLITLKEVGSTNTFLKDAVSKSTPLLDGTVILAEKQFAGRGQSKNSWLSEPGKNLTFSILLNPAFLLVEQQFILNMAVSLALNDVLSKYAGFEASIKWPNDIFIGGKKVGGMLIENIILGNQIRHAIIGIGLNVNQVDFPSYINNVTSLKLFLHTDYDLLSCLGEICSAVEARYLQLMAGSSAEIRSGYLNKLYLIDQWALFKFDDKIQSGKITGVSEIGLLQVETTDGPRQFDNKEIEFIHD